MRKLLTLALVGTMTMTMLVGCGKNNKAEEQTPAPTPVVTETAAPTETPATNNETGLVGDLTTIMDQIYANKEVPLNLATMPVDLADPDAVKAFTGLDDASKIKEAVASEPMMGSQAYSVVLVRTNDAADAEAVADAMKAGIDPRKWICVTADNVNVAGYGDVVMLVMISSELSESAASTDDIVNAFQTVCGGTLDFTK